MHRSSPLISRNQPTATPESAIIRSKMEMDCDTTSRVGEEESGNPVVVMLVGAPGSGKSTFCDRVMQSSTCRQWVRVCQDTIKNGKAGTKSQCLLSASSALKGGKSVFIDRCNLDVEQRAEFVRLGNPQVEVHAVVLDLPAQLCISRSVKRSGHEGNLQGGKAAAVVNRMLQKKELPQLSEGFTRITFCQNDRDVQGALDTYIGFGPSDNLPSGCHGEKKANAKVQLGIMKFLKKVEAPSKVGADSKSLADSTSAQSMKGIILSTEAPVAEHLSPGAASVGETDQRFTVGSGSAMVSLKDVPTLAFPSISTSDFQFNLEKASDIIVEKVEEFASKLENAKLVLVDLSHGSKILSLVRAKAAQRNVNSRLFTTVVGDITKLHSEGGLRCNVIANAANWRLKPGGGGVNAAVYNAAGPDLDSATKERAGSLLPGKAVTVPLPSTSPLFLREGVTHIIHVLGPNMNPHRPNCLNNDYSKGCKILRDAYTSLFEGFSTLVQDDNLIPEGSTGTIDSGPSKSQNQLEAVPVTRSCSSEQKTKREGAQVSTTERTKKCRGLEDVCENDHTDTDQADIAKQKVDKSVSKSWGSWAQALYHIAMHPEKYQNDLLEMSNDVVVINDAFPKAQRHILVVGRLEGLDCLTDVQKEHLYLLKAMHIVGLKWAEKFLCENASLKFRLGYHSAPSMRQLHLHVISQDFNSKHLKNKKHWNSFSTAFFRDSADVIDEISTDGKATIEDESLLSTELRCHRCRSAHPNIPRLKSHISHCRAAFPSTLLQNGRLVSAPSKDHDND